MMMMIISLVYKSDQFDHLKNHYKFGDSDPYPSNPMPPSLSPCPPHLSSSSGCVWPPPWSRLSSQGCQNCSLTCAVKVVEEVQVEAVEEVEKVEEEVEEEVEEVEEEVEKVEEEVEEVDEV